LFLFVGFVLFAGLRIYSTNFHNILWKYCTRSDNGRNDKIFVVILIWIRIQDFFQGILPLQY